MDHHATHSGRCLDAVNAKGCHRAQGKNLIPLLRLHDCTRSRFFEVYHASLLSFKYLREFYMGEVEDRCEVPAPDVPPSSDFLDQLRQYTAPYRLEQQPRHTHLGGGSRSKR